MIDLQVIDAIRARLREHHRKTGQWRQGEAAMRLDGVRKLSDVPDDELIATDTSIPSAQHQMEMRRLKVAIERLTGKRWPRASPRTGQRSPSSFSRPCWWP